MEGTMFIKVLMGIIVAGVAVLVLAALISKGSLRRYENTE
jgi:hypothetical protein